VHGCYTQFSDVQISSHTQWYIYNYMIYYIYVSIY
jgi:hypothetical protein